MGARSHIQMPINVANSCPYQRSTVAYSEVDLGVSLLPRVEMVSELALKILKGRGKDPKHG